MQPGATAADIAAAVIGSPLGVGKIHATHGDGELVLLSDGDIGRHKFGKSQVAVSQQIGTYVGLDSLILQAYQQSLLFGRLLHAHESWFLLGRASVYQLKLLINVSKLLSR